MPSSARRQRLKLLGERCSFTGEHNGNADVGAGADSLRWQGSAAQLLLLHDFLKYGANGTTAMVAPVLHGLLLAPSLLLQVVCTGAMSVCVHSNVLYRDATTD